MTEAFEAKDGGEAFLFGNLEQWSIALNATLAKLLPWEGNIRLSPAYLEEMVAELDSHLFSAYPKIPSV